MTIEYLLSVSDKNNKLIRERHVTSDCLPRVGDDIDALFQRGKTPTEHYRVYEVIHRLTERGERFTSGIAIVHARLE